MKQSSANILREGKREIRALNDVCDASCFVWFSCSNSVPSGTCRGFALMNHQTRTHLNKILNEDDNKYIESCVTTLQRGCDAETEETLVSEVLRYLPPQPTQRKEGCLGQLEASRGVQNTPTSENVEPESHSNTEFTRMLKAARGKGEQPHTAIERVIQSNHEDMIPREGGVVTMFERVVARRTNDEPEPIETRDLSTYRVPYGFSEMIEAAFPHGNVTTPDNNVRVVRRGMGFAAMLEASRRGTE